MNIEITSAKAVEYMVKAIPYPEQITDMDITDDRIYFTWRHERFKYEFKTCGVWIVKGSLLEGSAICILMEKLLKMEHVKAVIY